jgi:hypothetical protein
MFLLENAPTLPQPVTFAMLGHFRPAAGIAALHEAAVCLGMRDEEGSKPISYGFSLRQ